MYIDIADNVFGSRNVIVNNTVLSTSAGAGINTIEVNAAQTASTSVQAVINNNNIQTATGAASNGIVVTSATAGSVCADINNNTVTLQSTGGFGMDITAPGTGIINLESLSGNIIPDINVTGNVNLVAPGTCSP